jgi:hypothetical protein
MKVLNLRCTHDHRFEGWFGSDADYVAQGERGLLTCPMCNDTTISRLPSAPHLNVSRPQPNRALQPGRPGDRAGSETVAMGTQVRMQAQWLRAVREMLNSTEDVGDRFPDEARRIHYGETPERGIRGRASREDAQALRDEGIEVVAVPLPAALKGPLQ